MPRNKFYVVTVTVGVRTLELLKQEKLAPPLKCAHRNSYVERPENGSYYGALVFYAASGVAIGAGIIILASRCEPDLVTA